MTASVYTVHRFYDALRRGDVASVLSLLDADVRWTEAESFPYYSGTWQGPKAVVERLLIPLSQEWDNFAATPYEFVAQADRVVTLGTYSGTYKKTGKSLSAAFAHVWTVRDDKLVTFDMHTDTAKVLEALRG
jgi:uncharacterized protein